MPTFDFPRLLRMVRAGADERLVRLAALRQALRRAALRRAPSTALPPCPPPGLPPGPPPGLPPLRLTLALRAVLRLLGLGGPRVAHVRALPPLALPAPDPVPEADTGRVLDVREGAGPSGAARGATPGPRS
ncbi:hypothetical protein [Desulfocurvus vexinensis]|uniref:hypothetical protein n=1 Tax=Desulfocurvus vexinensis TaxID=399548 RepID=UPI00048E2E74|nr:hypothetical protein [Desulfocurvus vexinensis]